MATNTMRRLRRRPLWQSLFFAKFDRSLQDDETALKDWRIRAIAQEI
jgi:hypothetical protein